MSNATDKQTGAVQTTGHAWDGDLQEYNNPLPRWWVWTFYATVIFAIVYWILYPAWPIGTSYTKGIGNTITFTVDQTGEETTTHWNTRALLAHDMEYSDGAVKQQQYLNEIIGASYDEILSDPDKSAFMRSYAKGLFGDNCAACHGSGGTGVVGLFPNLVDDAWLWGGSTARIEETLRQGRMGFMPGFGPTFTEAQLDATAAYVLSMSGHEGGDAEQVAMGQKIFKGETGGCYYCHTSEGTGLESVGSANLTDSIWTVADVNGAEGYEAKHAAVKHVIENGISRHMPAWEGRLSDGEIKLLTAYVYSLSGGQ
jgi:cytochrome c oxidase cbb3-type subunit 3